MCMCAYTASLLASRQVRVCAYKQGGCVCMGRRRQSLTHTHTYFQMTYLPHMQYCCVHPNGQTFFCLQFFFPAIFFKSCGNGHSTVTSRRAVYVRRGRGNIHTHTHIYMYDQKQMYMCICHKNKLCHFVLACGNGHTTAVTSRGAVYAWGRGSHGQLGLGDVKGRCLPTRIREGLDGHKVCCSCVAVVLRLYCSVLQCVAVCRRCLPTRIREGLDGHKVCCSCVAVVLQLCCSCCSVLQCVAVCCSMLCCSCVAVCCIKCVAL